jgi:hypothetical protein
MQPTLVLPPSKNTENTSEDKNTIKIIEFNTARNGNNDDDNNNNNNNNVVTNNQTISEPLTVEEKKEKDGGGDEKKVVEKEQIFSPVSALIQTPQPPPPPLLHLSSSSSAKKVVDRVLKSDPTLRPSSLSEPVLIDEAKLEEKEKKEDMYKNLKVEESFEKSEKSLVKKSSGHHNSHFLDDELSIDLDSDSDSVLSFFDEQEKQN